MKSVGDFSLSHPRRAVAGAAQPGRRGEAHREELHREILADKRLEELRPKEFMLLIAKAQGELQVTTAQRMESDTVELIQYITL